MIKKQKKIECTVGILTYNSGKTIGRCLESVKDFAEIILIDGGSSDETIKIGQDYGCRVVSQSNPGQPIKNFSKERNLGLKGASNYWFFYIDSDEIATPELVEDIRRITSEKEPEFLIYEVQYKLTNPDFSVQYTSFKPRYQKRFFNKRTGAYFIKEVHERITFDEEKYSVGRLESCWLVPLDTQLKFKEYKKKVDHRLPKTTQKWTSRNPFLFLYKAILPEIISFIKQVIRMIVLRIREPWNTIAPFRYEIYRLYTPLFMIGSFTKRYFKLILTKH